MDHLISVLFERSRCYQYVLTFVLVIRQSKEVLVTSLPLSQAFVILWKASDEVQSSAPRDLSLGCGLITHEKAALSARRWSNLDLLPFMLRGLASHV